MTIRDFTDFEGVQFWRQELVQKLLRALVVVGVLAALAGAYNAYAHSKIWLIPFYLGAYALLLTVTFWRRVPYVVQALAPTVMLYGLGVLDFIEDGRGGSGRLFLFVVPFMAGLFFGRRESVIALVVIVLTTAFFGWAFCAGVLTIDEEFSSVDPAEWLSNAVVLLMLGTFVVISSNYVTPRLAVALAHARRLTQELEKHRMGLERQVSLQRTIVQRYVAHMAQISEGNLSGRLAFAEEDEAVEDSLTALGNELSEMTTSLQGMIYRIREASDNLRAAASEILTATTQQASGASEQSAAIAQTTTTVDELKTIAEQSVARAQEVVGASQRTVEVARTGREAVEETIGSMAQIKARVEGIAENILALAEQTQQVGEIIATVNDIAAQSNMLALNASVEAARAGEYGKGFAVVAVEVRNLAEQSRQATAQVKGILSDIQKATNAAVMATEEGTKRVEEGAQLTVQAGEAIEQLARVIEESAQAAMQLVAGGRQQASGVEQVAVAMQSINQAMAQSLASTRQAEEAARKLNELAQSLIGVVEQYRA